jgi:hypothetical protein
MHENRETSGVPRPERERGRSAKTQSQKADTHALEESDRAILSMNQTRYGVHIPPEEKAKINAELRGKTKQDYWKLLGSNPCATRKALLKDYSAEPAFGEHVQSKVGPC